MSLSKPTVTMQMFEIYNEVIKDLLQRPGGATGFLEVSENAPRGVHVRVSLKSSLAKKTKINKQTKQCKNKMKNK